MKKLLLFTIFLTSIFMANANTRMSTYRWRNDDGNESTATWKAATNTPIIINNLNPLRLRIAVEDFNTSFSGVTGVNANLEYSENGGAWQSITATSSMFTLVSSSFVTDNTTTTQQISSGNPTNFMGGLFKSTNTNTAYTLSVDGNNFCEHEFCIKPTLAFSPSSIYTFRIPGLSDPQLVTPTIVVSGSALNFDGSNDYVSVVSPTNMPVGNSNYTIESWMKPATQGINSILGWGNVGTVNQTNVLRLSPTGIVNYWWANDLSVTYAFTLNTWYHVAATYDGTTRKIYVNGILAGSDTPVADSHNVSTANNFRIGSFNTGTGEYFNGNLDEVRIWNRALPQAEIQNNLNCELGSGQTGLVAYYKFNQGIDNASNTTITTLTDSSGNTNTGTLNGFTLTGTTSNWTGTGGVTTGNTCSTYLNVNDFEFSSKLSVYPNPSSDVFSINSDTRGTIVVYDLIGKIIKSNTIDLGITKLDLSNYPSGIYLMKVTNDKNETKTMKLIKQ
jgi:hypothetical protein